MKEVKDFNSHAARVSTFGDSLFSCFRQIFRSLRSSAYLTVFMMSITGIQYQIAACIEFGVTL